MTELTTRENLWEAPLACGPLDATIEVPGSKSLSNRYLVLAALGSNPVRLEGLLRSRDTELMMTALEQLGVICETDTSDETVVTVVPPRAGEFRGNIRVFCGLAGTVMRFVPALALYADGPVYFDGDNQAYKRPMKPLLDGLEQLGAKITYEGIKGHLPFTVIPPTDYQLHEDKHISIDSSASSQFISGLLLASARWDGEITVTHTGKTLPSMPHIRMTMTDIATAGGKATYKHKTWSVPTHTVQLPSNIVIEPDLSNAAPFLGAALIAGGTVRVPRWPSSSTQPGALLPGYLRDFGGDVTFDEDTHVLSVTGNGSIEGLGTYDLSPAGEIAPSLAALAALAREDSTFTGIAHLRGHETDRLAALTTEINRFGGRAEQTMDGLTIHAVSRDNLHGEVMESYADHRMATFAAMIGLVVPHTCIRHIETTKKTIPDFVGMWTTMVGHKND
ncbi:3-phosphoshikimate 1-carboxyvinyltransferase [Alloscardovia venturai]|uniref:3-phosphoshikimate 1-carboxyvinyltransferase n=1 Tax=Alloscardovia venturai TaxID=1769421 RepID=A0ABW2Y6L9_9BIFI